MVSAYIVSPNIGSFPNGGATVGFPVGFTVVGFNVTQAKLNLPLGGQADNFQITNAVRSGTNVNVTHVHSDSGGGGSDILAQIGVVAFG